MIEEEQNSYTNRSHSEQTEFEEDQDQNEEELLKLQPEIILDQTAQEDRDDDPSFEQSEAEENIKYKKHLKPDQDDQLIKQSIDDLKEYLRQEKQKTLKKQQDQDDILTELKNEQVEILPDLSLKH